MPSMLLKFLKIVAVLFALAVLGVLAIRTYDIQRGPSVSIWHTHVPHELRAAAIDKLDWAGYLKAEESLFDEVRREIVERIEPEERVAGNRYFDGSPIYPGRFKTDWNRSYVMEPEGAPVGAVVLLHGLTDSPYSLRHIARLYRDRGFVAIAIRLPGHGTVPAGLTKAYWEDWSAATRLAVREARRRIGPTLPLHMVGFSNGGALATQYAIEALSDAALSRPDRLVLISPMIGITAFARFAGVFGWPAVFPAFANAAWLSVVTEFNPFKYNSFPINGARQSSQLTRVLQDLITSAARDKRLEQMPPVLTFQSVVDFTVSTQAVVSALYGNLPANGSELVLFDVNRNARLSPLLRSAYENALDRLLPPPPRNFRTTIIANASPSVEDVVERVTAAGSRTEQTRGLDLTYPPEVFSLSHVAVPFPMDDALYGMRAPPGASDEYGVNLGGMAARGEVGLLIVTLDSLIRASSNPFFPYLMDRIDQGIAEPRASAPAPVVKP